MQIYQNISKHCISETIKNQHRSDRECTLCNLQEKINFIFVAE